jgi:hypothetical protein
VDVFEAVGKIDCETHENDVCVGVREGTQAIVVFLPWSERTEMGEKREGEREEKVEGRGEKGREIIKC